MTNAEVKLAAGVEIPRRWDYLVIISALLLITGGIHMNSMLLAGDWSFWVDWKDRQWWPLLTPAVNIILPAALQYILWDKLRLPIGATIGAVCLVGAQWISRMVSFEWWAHLPINYTWPETLILTAVLMDVVLLISRSYVITSLLGGALWGGLFWLANYPALAPFLQPIVYQGHVLTVADVLSFQLARSQGPEYLRMIEEGHLRALIGDITALVSFFAAMVCAGMYWFGLAIGKFLGVLPIGKTFRLQTD
ncbi:MAG: methane monooxygenase/ammonia monooxygenase subunit A [Micromonosporaceae bacterium]